MQVTQDYAYPLQANFLCYIHSASLPSLGVTGVNNSSQLFLCDLMQK